MNMPQACKHVPFYAVRYLMACHQEEMFICKTDIEIVGVSIIVQLSAIVSFAATPFVHTEIMLFFFVSSTISCVG
jgi:hypothetical protein